MRRMIGLISVVGLVAVGIAAAPGAGAQVQAPATEDASAQAGSVRWGRCTDPTLVSFNAQCGVVKVPVDYDHPNGDQVDLAVSRVRHTVPDAQFQGVMLVNPGGPGGSGLILSVLGAFVPWRRRRRATTGSGSTRRGVGSSEDALSCIPDYFGYDRPNYVANTPQLEQVWLGRSQGYAAACARKNDPALLSNLTTLDSVRDMDSIRQALGQQQINYYGFSYGTYLGQVYGTLFPERVRRMVLDSNVDPRRVWYPVAARSGPRLRPQHRHLLQVDRQVPRRLPPGRDRSRPSRTSTTRCWPTSTPIPRAG